MIMAPPVPVDEIGPIDAVRRHAAGETAKAER